MAMDAGAYKMTRETTYYVGLQRTTQNGQAPVLFPDSIFCYHW